MPYRMKQKDTLLKIDASSTNQQSNPKNAQIITPPQPALKPEPPKDKLAEQTLSRLIEEERLAWRKNEETRLLEEAEKSRQAAWKIKAKEPKKPLLGLYATDQWKTECCILGA